MLACAPHAHQELTRYGERGTQKLMPLISRLLLSSSSLIFLFNSSAYCSASSAVFLQLTPSFLHRTFVEIPGPPHHPGVPNLG
jgi:hypothetical protein